MSSRTLDEDALMRVAADTSLEFWRKCGNWVNEERALYLKALVANELGVPNDALTHANAALAIIDANGARPIDAAVLRLARSRAFALLGDADGRQHEITLADLAAARSPDAALKAWFAEQRAKAVATAPRDFEDQSWPNRLGV